MNADEVHAPRRSFGRSINLPSILVFATSVSYLTTFIRERYFYQHSLGTITLDHVEVSLSIVAIVSNSCGLVVILWSSAGRLNGKISTLVVAAIAVASVPLWWVARPEALLVEFGVFSFTFLYWSQRAANDGKQIYAIAAAITAPAPTILVWTLTGTRTVNTTLLGYVAGALWQAVGALLAGRKATTQTTANLDVSMLWPLLYVIMVQADAVVDQGVLLLGGRGWAGAGALAFSFFSAATVVVVAPIANQALAGRLNLENSRKLLLLIAVVSVAFIGVAIEFLPLLIRGGSVAGVGLRRIIELTLLYGLGLPFSIYWHVMTRASYRRTGNWRSSALQAVLLLLVHAIVVTVIALTMDWVLVPLATVVSLVAVTIVYIKMPTQFGADPIKHV